MNDVVSGILDDLDYCKNRKRGNISLNYNECDLLLDYITNLQEELRLQRAKNKSLLNTHYGSKTSQWESKYYDLQKENKRLKEDLHKVSLDIQEMIEKDIWCPSNCDKLINLQEENKKLKTQLNCKEYFSATMPENTEFVILTKNNYDRQQKDIQLDLINYKSRNEKAIEYITTEQLYTNYQWGKSHYVKILKDLLNILQGVDKDV